MTRARALRVAIIAVLVLRVGLSAGDARADDAEAKKIFTTRCMACHTFGKGVKVGPDLKGVNERRKRDWLVKFVRGSSAVIASGDPIATELFTQFKGQRMPDWVDLSEETVNGILDWLGKNGPDQQDPDVKLAELATESEIDAGRQLFHGGKPIASGAAPCANCHSITDNGKTSGGTLSRDLTRIFAVYQDVQMTLFLKKPCSLRYPEATNRKFLAPEESYALKSYLRDTAIKSQPADAGMPAKPTVAKTTEGGGSGAAPAAASGDKPPGRRATWEIPVRTVSPGIGKSVQDIPGELLFASFPYAALIILLVGLAIRYAVGRRNPEAMAAQAKSAWRALTDSRLWQIGLAVTIILHIVSLVAPNAVLGWDRSSGRLYLLEGVGMLLGIVALVGWVQVMIRHVNRAVASGSLTEITDCIFLSVLCMAVVSGLLTAFVYRWGSAWGEQTLAPYMSSLAGGKPLTALVQQMPFLVRLHVFTWFIVIALVPFTSVSNLIIPAVDRVLTALSKPVGAAGAAGRRTAKKLSPAHLIWPEEDAVDPSAKDSDNAH
ncbi:MAG TPA: respiratory nitrate reductase subunit gamma [Kofleriaceae bacterium]|nr:respiratory nitrate reductase subunit gamma [Kofleriaceae bacterium]